MIPEYRRAAVAIADGRFGITTASMGVTAAGYLGLPRSGPLVPLSPAVSIMAPEASDNQPGPGNWSVAA